LVRLNVSEGAEYQRNDKLEYSIYFGAHMDTLIKVGASSSPGRIAGAIAHNIYDGKNVVIRAIGASAVNQAVKSIIVARGYVTQRNFELFVQPSFAEINDEVEGHSTTIIVFTVLASPITSGV
jgi:stage V sporulation protein S